MQDEHGFTGKYSSVRRYVHKLSQHAEFPFRRIEVEPGYGLQLDYGTGARCQDHQGVDRKSYIFRAVLSHPRKGYTEAVRQLTTESLIRSLENAFRVLGGRHPSRRV